MASHWNAIRARLAEATGDEFTPEPEFDPLEAKEQVRARLEELEREPEPEPEPQVITSTKSSGSFTAEFTLATIERDERGRLSRIVGDGWMKTVIRDENGMAIGFYESRETLKIEE